MYVEHTSWFYCCSINTVRNYYFVRPFDEALYEDEVDEDEVMDEEGRARLKLKASRV